MNCKDIINTQCFLNWNDKSSGQFGNKVFRSEANSYLLRNVCSPGLDASDKSVLVGDMIKNHVRGFFDNDLHEVSSPFATNEAVRSSGF